MSATAQHRPPVRRRRFRHDDLVAVDLFSGFGGLSQGIERAGFTTIMAANHNEYKVEVHEANHPHAEHWIADLVNPDSADYHSARDLPAADLLVAGVSCVNHSQANAKKAYEQGISLFDLADPDYEERVTRSERDRATANCLLHYAERHHPLMILSECTTELASWGAAIPGRPKVGDGSTYRWWLRQFKLLGYRCRVLYLNSMFFGVPQSRDRGYWVFWDSRLPNPDLDHRPAVHCADCDKVVEAVWTWKTGVPPTGSVRHGKQYVYRCPRCRAQVTPPFAPSLMALDLSNLGPRIADRKRPLAAATMARAERCRQRFAEFPAVVVMPAHRHNGDGQPISRPMDTVTATHEKAILTTAVLMKAAGNTYERPASDCRSRGLNEPMWTQSGTQEAGVLSPPVAMAIDNFQGAGRGVDEPLPTQGGSETLGLLSAGMLANRTNATGRGPDEPMATVVAGAGSGGLGVLSTGIVPFRRANSPVSSDEPLQTVSSQNVPGLLTAAGRVQCNGSIEEARYRAYPIDRPLGTVVGSAITQGLLFSGWYKQNGSTGAETAAHPVTDALGTLTGRDTTALLTAEWREVLADLKLEDCHFRMMASHEIGRGCGFDVNFGDYAGSFVVWGSARDQVDGFGNAVSPQVGEWISDRLRRVLQSEAP